MKKLFAKKSLGLRHTQKEVKKYVEIGNAPLIATEITLTGGAKVETTSAAVKLLGDALGEDIAAAWHSKYMNKFDKLLKQAYSELEGLVKSAKAERK